MANLNAETIEKKVSSGTIIDKISLIENVIGSDFDDTFITNLTTSNTIDGGESNINSQGSEISGDYIDYSSNGASKIVVDLSTTDGNGYSTVTVSGTSAANDLVKILKILKVHQGMIP